MAENVEMDVDNEQNVSERMEDDKDMTADVSDSDDSSSDDDVDLAAQTEKINTMKSKVKKGSGTQSQNSVRFYWSVVL